MLRYIIKQYISCIHHKKPFSSVPFSRGMKMYKEVVSGKKSIFRIFIDIYRLSKYWKVFPDSYFRFGMFMKDYTDFDKMKSFIPQQAYYPFSKAKDARYNLLIDDKILFHDIMSYYGLPVPKRYFIYRNGEFRNASKILTNDEVNSILKNINDDRIFVKLTSGGGASGIFIYTKKENGIYVDDKKNEVSAEMIKEKYRETDLIFEEQIKQDKILAQFNPDTVNTIRILTYKDKIASATVRFGGKGDFIDNLSKGGVAVSCDIETGELGEYGMRIYDINKYYEHPDSKIKFKGVRISQWEEIKNIITKSLNLLPYYKSVGFDIATTDEGPVIIEINTGAGIGLSQIGREYGLADTFLESKK